MFYSDVPISFVHKSTVRMPRSVKIPRSLSFCYLVLGFSWAPLESQNSATHEEGKYIFWEFATDYCDIGFGLHFEWTVAPSNAISVHVSDSSEEDELDDDEGMRAVAV